MARSYVPNLLDTYTLPKDEEATLPVVDMGNMPAVLGSFSLLQGEFVSPNFVKGRSGWKIASDGSVEFSNGTFRGDLEAGSINIPDSTTASSFHVDSDGNAWWGANVSTGYAGAAAYILATGSAIFKNVQIGGSTLQYQATNNGVFSFGDGSDGAYTFSNQGTAPTGTTKTDNTNGATVYRLDRDIYATTFTVDATVTVNPNGYRIFASTSLTNNGTISRNGNAGGNGGNSSTGGGGGGTAGTAGAALADGYLKGSLVGKVGGTGTNGVGGSGGSGSNTTNSIGSSGVAGGNGGNGSSAGGSGGTGGTATASNVKLIANWHLATLLDISSSGTTVKFDNSASSGGGGAGGGDNGIGIIGSGGGGSGSSGGIVAIYAKSITNTGTISVNGGNGGNGGNGVNGGFAGGGGGGGGGNGGELIMVYNAYTNSGTVSASGGTGGTGGTSAGAGAGVNGTNGTAGNIRLFQLSL